MVKAVSALASHHKKLTLFMITQLVEFLQYLSCGSRAFLRVLRFSFLIKINISSQYRPTVIGTCYCGNPALVAKLNKNLKKTVIIVSCTKYASLFLHHQTYSKASQVGVTFPLLLETSPWILFARFSTTKNILL